MPQYTVSALYHFTDERNLESIRQQGGILSLAELRSREVGVLAPGGNPWSHDADTAQGLDQYVHLCFRDEHPMEWTARQDGRIQDSVFLNINPSIINWPGVRITADVSNKAGVESYPWAEAGNRLDCEVLFTRTNWKDPEILARYKQAKKSELLVPRMVPLNMIRNPPWQNVQSLFR